MSEEKTVTVMRKEEDMPYKDSSLQVKTAVMAGDGTVVMREGSEEPTPEMEVKAELENTTVVSDKMNEITSVHAPEDTDEEKAQMEEVSYEDYIKSKQVALNSPNTTEQQGATQRVKELIGKTADEARSVLEDMAGKKQVASFRFVPIGMPMSMEIEPGRVQVLCDASRKVIDVSIS